MGPCCTDTHQPHPQGDRHLNTARSAQAQLDYDQAPTQQSITGPAVPHALSAPAAQQDTAYGPHKHHKATHVCVKAVQTGQLFTLSPTNPLVAAPFKHVNRVPTILQSHMTYL